MSISENTVISQFKMYGMWRTTFSMHMNFRKAVSEMLDAFVGSDLNQVVQSFFMLYYLNQSPIESVLILNKALVVIFYFLHN